MSDESRTPLTVFFDGDCAMCSRLVAWALRRDRDGLLRPVPAGSDQAARLAGRDATPRLLEELHVFSAAGGLARGPEAVAALLARLPGWRWAAPWVGARALAPVSRPLYRWIAARRRWFNGSCPLPPQTAGRQPPTRLT